MNSTNKQPNMETKTIAKETKVEESQVEPTVEPKKRKIVKVEKVEEKKEPKMKRTTVVTETIRSEPNRTIKSKSFNTFPVYSDSDGTSIGSQDSTKSISDLDGEEINCSRSKYPEYMRALEDIEVLTSELSDYMVDIVKLYYDQEPCMPEIKVVRMRHLQKDLKRVLTDVKTFIDLSL